VEYDKKINVWGCFCTSGVGNIMRIEGTLVKETYLDILDGWFVDNTVPLLQWWPVRSPDLNPIKNLWSILDLRCSKRSCNNEVKLFHHLKTE
jgi:hypothetical protein